jgi:hypothetical protein
MSYEGFKEFPKWTKDGKKIVNSADEEALYNEQNGLDSDEAKTNTDPDKEPTPNANWGGGKKTK